MTSLRDHWRTLRFGLMTALLLLNLAALWAGGFWPWASFALIMAIATIGDEASGDDIAATPARRLYDAALFLTLLLVAANALLLLFAAGSDPLGLAERLPGLASLRERHDPWSLAGSVLAVGFFFGAGATNVAHELIHRADPRAYVTGRWLLAFTLDTGFAIEHVHGHHRYVGTSRDPATARRGEYVLAFVVRSTLGQVAGAFRLEAERLRRRGLPVLSLANRAIRGQLMSAALLAGAAILGGWIGLALFLACAVQGKLYLELANYIEHYGLVREPGARIEARHSWNSYRAVSSGVLYNLPRHSHHHLFAAKPFWTLEPEPGAPTLPFGYKTMILASLVPPLWNRLMEPRLRDWDTRLASEAERRIAEELRLHGREERRAAGGARPAA